MNKYKKKDSEYFRAVEYFKKNLLIDELWKYDGNILAVSRSTGLSRNNIYKIIGMNKKELKQRFFENSTIKKLNK